MHENDIEFNQEKWATIFQYHVFQCFSKCKILHNHQPTRGQLVVKRYCIDVRELSYIKRHHIIPPQTSRCKHISHHISLNQRPGKTPGKTPGSFNEHHGQLVNSPIQTCQALLPSQAVPSFGYPSPATRHGHGTKNCSNLDGSIPIVDTSPYTCWCWKTPNPWKTMMFEKMHLSSQLLKYLFANRSLVKYGL